jgi:hypothetical protein
MDPSNFASDRSLYGKVLSEHVDELIYRDYLSSANVYIHNMAYQMSSDFDSFGVRHA